MRFLSYLRGSWITDHRKGKRMRDLLITMKPMKSNSCSSYFGPCGEFLILLYFKSLAETRLEREHSVTVIGGKG